MVEARPSRHLPGPAAIAVLWVLAVAGVVADGSRGDAGHTPRAAEQTTTSGWNATYAPTSGGVVARNVGYDPTTAPGASFGIGFQAAHTGKTAKPASLTLNGAVCATA